MNDQYIIRNVKTGKYVHDYEYGANGSVYLIYHENKPMIFSNGYDAVIFFDKCLGIPHLISGDPVSDEDTDLEIISIDEIQKGVQNEPKY